MMMSICIQWGEVDLSGFVDMDESIDGPTRKQTKISQSSEDFLC